MVANWDCVISYRPKKFHNPQESGLDRMLRFMLYYRKAGYSKAFLEAHREEITLHKAAKAAFDEAGLQKLPKVKELDTEFAEQCACYPYIFPTIFPRAAAGRSLHKRLRNLYCAPAA